MSKTVELWVLDLGDGGHPKFGLDASKHIMVLAEDNGNALIIGGNISEDRPMDSTETLLLVPINIKFDADKCMAWFEDQQYFSAFEASDGYIVKGSDEIIRVGMYRETAVALDMMYGIQVNEFIKTTDWSDYVEGDTDGNDECDV